MFTGSVYDSYSYLFTNPTFISLDPNAVPGNVPVKGMRIGVNGVIGVPGQSYSTLNTTLGGSNYTAANGQLLSSVGGLVASDKGVDTDQFFLSFDQFGTVTHAFTEPVPATPTPPPDTTNPDVGVKDFAAINGSMSTITGIQNWAANTTISTAYNSLQQSLPSTPDITAFLSSNQTAVNQLASAYCGQLVGTTGLRTAFFGSGLEANLNTSSASFFNTSGNRGIVVNALVSKVVGTQAYAATQTAVQTETDMLLQRLTGATITGMQTIPSANVPSVQKATTAACTAVLASAAVSVK
jgi:hypothetical protein